MAVSITPQEFWARFLSAKGLDSGTEYFECFHFCLDEAPANELLGLVLSGKKRATCSSLFAYDREGSRLPQIGDYSIVTDWEGNPRCVIQTTAITRLPFDEISFDICRREGEDDNLASWQMGHRKFFRQEGKQLGYEFSEDMPVIFEDFEVVYLAQ